MYKYFSGCYVMEELRWNLESCSLHSRWLHPSGRSMALQSTQPLIEMSDRNISWAVKTAGVWYWKPYHLHLPIVLISGSFNFVEPSGLLQDSMGVALPCCVNTFVIFEVVLCIRTYYYYYYYLLQLSFQSVAVVLTVVTNKNKYKRKIQKYCQYKYTYNQNTHTSVKTTHTLQNPYMHTTTH